MFGTNPPMPGKLAKTTVLFVSVGVAQMPFRQVVSNPGWPPPSTVVISPVCIAMVVVMIMIVVINMAMVKMIASESEAESKAPAVAQ